jgi:hypothetical protein
VRGRRKNLPRGDALASTSSPWEWIGVIPSSLFSLSLPLLLAPPNAQTEHRRKAIQVSTVLTTDDRSGQVQRGRFFSGVFFLASSRARNPLLGYRYPRLVALLIRATLRPPFRSLAHSPSFTSPPSNHPAPLA